MPDDVLEPLRTPREGTRDGAGEPLSEDLSEAARLHTAEPPDTDLDEHAAPVRREIGQASIIVAAHRSRCRAAFGHSPTPVRPRAKIRRISADSSIRSTSKPSGATRRSYSRFTTQHLPWVTPQQSRQIIAKGKCTESYTNAH